MSILEHSWEGVAMERAMRVVLIHPNRLLREGLAYALSQQQGISVVAACATTEVLDEFNRLSPDIVIMTLSLPGRDILQEVRHFRAASPTTKILMIGLSELESDVLACIEAGVAGYLLHEASLEELVQNIRAVAIGEAFCSPRITGLLFHQLAERAREREQRQSLGIMHLTRREIEVVALLEKGLSNKEIAAHMQIELQTVKNHVHNILEKLQLRSRREAARYAREQGLLEHVY
jgi:two-component system NarL family response regulator